MAESRSTGFTFRWAAALLGLALIALPGCASTGKAQARIDAFNQSAGPMIAVPMAKFPNSKAVGAKARDIKCSWRGNGDEQRG